MNILSIIGVGIIAAVIAVLLRQYHPEYAMLVSLAAGVVILLQIAQGVLPVVDEIGVILQSAGLPLEYAEILLKALGICILTQVASDTCKDAGESAIASKLEIAGKVAVMLVSLPLFSQLLRLVGTLIG